jgi:hypothetical protein
MWRGARGSSPGPHRLERLLKNASAGISQRHYLESMQQSLPSVNPDDIIIVNNVRMILLDLTP